MAKTYRDVTDNGPLLAEQPPMVVDDSDLDRYEESAESRFSSFERPAFVDRLMRTPIHREVSVLVAAGVIALVGLILYLNRSDAADTDQELGLPESAALGEAGDSAGSGGSVDQASPSTIPLTAEPSGADRSGPGSSSSEPAGADADAGTSDGTAVAVGGSETDGPSFASFGDADDDASQDGDTADGSTSGSTATSAVTSTPSSVPPEQPDDGPATTQASTTTTAAPTTAVPTTQPPTTQPPTTQPPTTQPPTTVDAGLGFRGGHRLPARIEAEFFDTGGSGVSYNDSDQRNVGGAMRPNQSVDVGVADSGRVFVGRTRNNEWLEYTVTVPEDANFYVEVSVASDHNGPGALVVQVDGSRFARLNVRNTGSNDSWERLRSQAKLIPAGTRKIRLNVTGGGRFRLDWFALQQAG